MQKETINRAFYKCSYSDLEVGQMFTAVGVGDSVFIKTLPHTFSGIGYNALSIKGDTSGKFIFCSNGVDVIPVKRVTFDV